jgi:hypothetical protein
MPQQTSKNYWTKVIVPGFFIAGNFAAALQAAWINDLADAYAEEWRIHWASANAMT